MQYKAAIGGSVVVVALIVIALFIILKCIKCVRCCKDVASLDVSKETDVK